MTTPLGPPLILPDILTAVSRQATRLLTTTEWESVVPGLLVDLGEAAQVSRVALWRLHHTPDGQRVQSLTHAWSSPSVPALIDDPSCRNMPLYGSYDVLHRMTEMRLRGETVVIQARDLTGRTRALFDQQHCLSYVSVPILIDGQLWGHIGLDECVQERVWQAEEITALRALSAMLAAAIARSEQERVLANNERQLALILANVADAVLTLAPNGRIVMANRAAARLLTGIDQSLMDLRLEDYLPAAALAPPGRHGQALLWSSHGDPVPVEWSVTGAWDQRIITLRDVSERLALEERIRHSQKMEAISQLTGGIAHDFNNLLTVILGNLDLLSEQIPAGNSTLERQLNIGLRAARRGADLTRQLLAFSRRQFLKPESVDLARHLAGVAEEFERLLGPKVTVTVQVEPELPPILLDPGQFEDALLNLAVNARDAMPDGGEFTLSARRQPDGMVALSLTDTGTGIPPHILPRVFDPFFTTKEAGRGSGLGLSMVYGFIHQSGGDVRIDAVEGKGTSVHLVLPAATQTPAPVYPPTLSRSDGATSRGETVLVVEDDDNVRALAVSILNDFGYRTAQAEHAAKALSILREGLKIDVLFTDLVLPGGMDGIDLARTARSLLPGVKVLLTSGYAEPLSRHGSLIPEMAILEKPYDSAGLTTSLRQLLAPGGPSCGDER